MEYKTWNGLFYHKRKVHNCENVCLCRYELLIKNAAKIAEEKERKCMHCHKHHHKPAMEKHYLKSHKEKFVWMKCKLCQKEH